MYGVYPLTKNTIIEPTLMLEELARIRSRGYSSEFEETVEGGCCFVAPIRVDDEARAAISVSLPIARFYEGLDAKLGEILMKAAARIEKNFAAHRPHALRGR